MELNIKRVIYHILDTGASEPLLSDRETDLDADLTEYFMSCLEKAFAADDGRMCEFLPDSAFAQELSSNQDFIDLSRRIAGVIFEQMLQYPSIPAGDLAVVDFSVGGVPYLGVLKLNYRPGYTHQTRTLGNAQYSGMTPQRTLLPGNPKDPDDQVTMVTYSAWADGEQFAQSMLGELGENDTYTVHIDAESVELGIDSFLINITAMDRDGNSARGTLMVKVSAEDSSNEDELNLTADQRLMM